MPIDIAHSVLGGGLIAVSSALIGKILGNKSVIDRIDKLETKLGELVSSEMCTTKHAGLEKFLRMELKHVNDKLDKLNNR